MHVVFSCLWVCYGVQRQQICGYSAIWQPILLSKKTNNGCFDWYCWACGLQFYKPYYNQEMVDKAHAHGIICNVCWSNTRHETEEFIKMGMDVILTDEFKRVQNWVKEFTE